MECRKCGTCCTAPDISTLGKLPGVRCRHLTEDHLCAIYGNRPQVCRNYRPDDICREVMAPTLAERVARYRTLFCV